MASSDLTERSPLLGNGPSQGQVRYASASSSSTPSRLEEHDVEEGQSNFSHVSLDTTQTYGRLIGSHILSLLPGIALLFATAMLAFHAPCHIHYDPADRRSDRKLCRKLLSDWMSLTAFSLGVISWLAAYSIRPAIWKIVEWSCLFIAPHQERQDSSSTLHTIVFVFLRTSCLESIRMFNIIIINAVLFAGLAHLQGKEIVDQPLPHWLLHWYDPRFTVGLWTAIGWCTTEFVVSTFQMFERLSLYKSVFEQATPEEEADDIAVAAANGTQTPPLSSSFDSHSAGDYLSDSAATVRARPEQDTQSRTDLARYETQNSTPKLLLQVGDIDNLADVNAASGFSNADKAEEQELKRLREKLEEEIVQARMRDEVRQTLGQDLPEVPILLCVLWRIDSLLWNLSTTLLISASVSLAQGPLSEQIPRLFPPFKLVKTSLFFLIAIHSVFTSAWTLLAGRFGFAFVTYTSLLAGLGLCVTALFRWSLLI